MSGPDETHKAGSEETHGSQAPQGPVPPAAEPDPDENLPARLGEERLAEPVVRTGLFGVQDTPDTSGYGLLRVHRAPILASPRPYGSYFDDVADELGRVLQSAGIGFSDAIERVVADRGELTFYVRRERLPEVAAKFRDDPALRFELCTGVSGVHYPDEAGRELHAVCRSRTTAGSGSRRPRRTPTGTSRRWSACTPPATGMSGRPGTCSASSSTATRG